MHTVKRKEINLLNTQIQSIKSNNESKTKEKTIIKKILEEIKKKKYHLEVFIHKMVIACICAVQSPLKVIKNFNIGSLARLHGYFVDGLENCSVLAMGNFHLGFWLETFNRKIKR